MIKFISNYKKKVWHKYDALMFRGIVIYMLGYGTPNMKDNTCLNNVLTNLSI
jgi:hypothetical protein